MTLAEVLVVIAMVILLAVILLPAIIQSRAKAQRLRCIDNLKQIGIAGRIWPSGQSAEYPAQVSVTNGGAMELALEGDVSAIFRVMSNVLDNPMVLTCPADKNRAFAANFATLNNSNISYFIGLDAAEMQPQSLLSGDDNLTLNGMKAQSGILHLHAKDSLSWTKDRHQGAGNILLGDGSIQQASNADLTSSIGLAANRLAIP